MQRFNFILLILLVSFSCAFPKSEATDVDVNRILTEFQNKRYSFNKEGGSDRKLFYQSAKKFNITNEAARTGLKRFNPKIYKTIFKD